mmetsp:Transcript_20805/g.43509  ORF Transcript_20805/g.43509 Transcript_20805/m.43509 type:complete len:106 (-) Transcript_20805:225-542(-)|eukprot:CAMPEP_0172439484 /NCGR_PEP_ID=MMETSP1065-20121228/461_1 /TAXON_ID=265537 /ORGANISM="Amphiprora paludosa, Strain CCMP125" /LENGTH=105 /DNA_ID=CAMNT_0013188171 /DNA_START=104 /DNA_END=421 /DNA_ORIENTATION=-
MAECEKRNFEGKLKPYPHVEKAKYGRAADPVGYLNAVEQRARERAVAVETVRILRERMIKCYRVESVNYHERCRKVAKDYYDLITQPSVGQLHPEWEDPSKKQGY